ncbi:MAG: glycosyltransferase family 2 protein, partial [Firmicutes bacterium]|nr:glycosyltransferase family 2 protein [Bacillota bacterium]
MDNIKVSVIVPVYNAAEYLERNLIFLCRQTLPEMEIILINDGSTDESLKIMTAFKMAFPDKFVVLDSKVNKGPGGARNIGLEHARGEYIGFVDCDDVVNEEMFELMYERAEKDKCDMVICAYRIEASGKDFMIDTSKFEDGMTITARRELIMNVGFLWNCIFKRELLEKNNMRFRENCIYEDIDFLEVLYFKIESIGFVRKSLYLHRDNERSSSRKKCDTDKFFAMIDEMIGSCLERCAQSKYMSDLKETIELELLGISGDIVLVYAENKCMTFNRIEKLNNMLKKHFG